VLLQAGAEQLQLAKMTANNAVVNNYLSHPQQRSLADELNTCKTEQACQAVQEKYQRLSDENNAALARAQALCESTGNCAERDRLYASGMPTGSKGLSAIPDANNIDAGIVGSALTDKNAQHVQSLINRPLSQEVVRLDAGTNFDAAGNVQIDPARFVAAIDNQNAKNSMALALLPTLFLPGPEDVVAGAVLATKAGQKLAEVVLVNGQKVWKYVDGTTARVGSQEAQAIARARIDNNFYAEGWSSSPAGLQTSTGIISANPHKTTTVLGTYAADTRSIVEVQMNLPKNNDVTSPVPGGFNLLNTDNQLFSTLGPQRFWDEVNKPFLDAAIKRGDDIALASAPTPSNMYRNGALSGFGREIKYLESQGYIFDASTRTMIRRP
jgi:hypothetical protein